MNTVEHLLSCLAEEAAELSQAATKALRFGLTDTWPENGLTNARKISKEYQDVCSLMAMLSERGLVSSLLTVKQFEAKRARVEKWMQHARANGALSD